MMTALNILHHDQNVLIAQTYVAGAGEFADNFGLHVGDEPQAVLARRAGLLEALGVYGVHQISWLNQVHGDGVHLATLGIDTPDADAHLSQERHHALAIMTADCVPVAVFDGQTVACIHAGWQGLVAGIIPKTLAKMNQATAYIGACIGGASYELPKEMAMNIVETCVNNGLVNLSKDELMASVLGLIDGDKAYLDVGRLAHHQLVACGAGVLNQDIDCTYTGDFHSHRRATHQQKRSGRMAMLIAKV